MEGEQSRKPLDPLVKTALALCISLIVITVVGMVLTAPDRSIPPYSVMDPAGLYQRVTIYVFANPGLAEEAALKEYLRGADPLARSGFERAVRGLYRLTSDTELGAMGFVPESGAKGERPSVGARVLFQGKAGKT